MCMYVSVYGHVHVSAGVIPVPKRAQDFPGIGVIGCCEVLCKRGVCSELRSHLKSVPDYFSLSFAVPGMDTRALCVLWTSMPGLGFSSMLRFLTHCGQEEGCMLRPRPHEP